ncbi:hypothetical protein [Candidatus Viridilinea mediisalina]|nr:hypothetical protein [Candidatus Viridilinea mediisalina]
MSKNAKARWDAMFGNLQSAIYNLHWDAMFGNLQSAIYNLQW